MENFEGHFTSAKRGIPLSCCMHVLMSNFMENAPSLSPEDVNVEILTFHNGTQWSPDDILMIGYFSLIAHTGYGHLQSY